MEETITETLKQIINILEQPISLSDIISIVVSIISIFIAILVPYKIMEKQNKISIFEKRFQIYDEINKIYKYAESIENLQTLPGIPKPTEQILADASLQIWYNMDKEITFSLNQESYDFTKYFNAIHKAINEQQTLIKTSEFLFGKDAFEFITELNNKYDSFLKVLSQNLFSKTGKNYFKTKEDFISFVKQNQEYSKIFKKYLKI